MHLPRLTTFCLLTCLVLTSSSTALAQKYNWKPALADADEFYDAAEDLHDRAERFRDPHVMPVTAQLEQISTDLYQLLKGRACPTDVVLALNAAGATLDQATVLMSLSCDLRTDRKAQSELANARRYFAATTRHIQNQLGIVPTPPAYYNFGYPSVPPYGVEVQYVPVPESPQPLRRVLVTGVK